MRSLWKLKNTSVVKYLLDPEKRKSYIVPRDSVIIKPWVGLNMSVHNGNQIMKVNITDNHVGYKMGEFAFTRKYTRKLKKKEKRKKKASTPKK